MVGRDGPAGSGQQEADVFVIFGITGDLAKVMTFRSLYRLEKRDLLQLPDRRRSGQRLDR
jgi:glucose-6-phosphate 1-dehydrogenase